MRTHSRHTFSISTISRIMIYRTMILIGACALFMGLVMTAPWRSALAQADAATGTREPCNNNDVQRGATVKSSKSNSSDRTAAPQATTVKGSKSNSSERQADPCAATTVKSSKSNSSERQMAPPPPPPAETANLNFSKSNVNRQTEQEPEGVTEDTDSDH